MRLVLLTAAALLALTACSDDKPTEATAPDNQQTTAAPSPSESAAIPPMGDGPQPFGTKGQLVGIDITVGAPVATPKEPIGVDGKPKTDVRYVEVPITLTNGTDKIAAFSLSAEINGREARVIEGDGGSGKNLFAGETFNRTRLVEVPISQTEVVFIIGANINGEPNTGKLYYRGAV